MNNWLTKNIGGRLLMVAMIVLLSGCTYPRVLDGSPVKIKTQCGKVFVTAHKVTGNLYCVAFDVAGEYTVNPDSLQLIVQPPSSEVKDIKIEVADIKMTIALQMEVQRGQSFLLKDKPLLLDLRLPWNNLTHLRRDKRPFPKLMILPCDLIMCNGKRVITDTIRFEVKEHPKVKSPFQTMQFYKNLEKELRDLN